MTGNVSPSGEIRKKELGINSSGEEKSYLKVREKWDTPGKGEERITGRQVRKGNFSSLRIVTIGIPINSKSSVTWMRQNKSIWDFWKHQCGSLSKFSQGCNPSKTPWSTTAGSARSQNSLEMDPSLLSIETKKKAGRGQAPPR